MSNITGIPRVDEFLGCLAELSLDDWLLLGRVERSARATAGEVDTAALIADSVVADRRLEVVRWYAADAIETAVQLVEASCPRPTRATRELLWLARLAAERAALAIIAREFLPEQDVGLLCAPLRDVFARHAFAV